jgi:hypothetical protein
VPGIGSPKTVFVHGVPPVTRRYTYRPAAGGTPPRTLRQRAVDKIAEIDARIADLTAIRGALTEVVDARCDSLTNCTCADCPIPFLTIGTAEHPTEHPVRCQYSVQCLELAFSDAVRPLGGTR